MTECPANTPVAIFGEGKEHCMAIGLTKMSTADIASINKGYFEPWHTIYNSDLFY